MPRAGCLAARSRFALGLCLPAAGVPARPAGRCCCTAKVQALGAALPTVCEASVSAPACLELTGQLHTGWMVCTLCRQISCWVMAVSCGDHAAVSTAQAKTWHVLRAQLVRVPHSTLTMSDSALIMRHWLLGSLQAHSVIAMASVSAHHTSFLTTDCSRASGTSASPAV